MNKIVISILNLIVLVATHGMLPAQQKEVTEILIQVDAHYKAQNVIDLEMEYKMFKGHDGKQPTEAYKGSIYKNGEVTQVKILGSEVLYFPLAQITISKENKTLFYNKIEQPSQQNLPMDTASFLKFYEAVSLNYDGNTVVIEMEKKSIPLPIPYSKITLYVDKENYAIEKEVMYLATKVPFVDDNGKDVEALGRIEVTFNSIPDPINRVLKLEDYVVLGPNNRVGLAKAFKDYTILDQTKL
jgi:hypothetical protein